MDESETRAEYIDPMIKARGWGEGEGSKVLREFWITDGRIQTGGKHASLRNFSAPIMPKPFKHKAQD